MTTTLLTIDVPQARSPLTRRSLLRATLSGAALWACGPRTSAAVRIPPVRATTASQTLRSWTDLTLALIRETQPSPPRAARVLALVHVAMAEAALAEMPATSGAISGAAATVLRQHFPQATSPITAMEHAATRSRTWIGGRAVHASQLGLTAGRDIGQTVVAWGQADGLDATWDGRRPTGPGRWQPTPPEHRQNPIEPLAGTWRPWVLPTGDALRPAPPPSWGSPEWEAELTAVKRAVARRTPEQAAAARFWAGGPGTVTPAGLWIEIAMALIESRGLEAAPAARVLALTSVAMADAFICCWDAKYAYWMARPITADPTLDELIPTPPFPSYTSGHSTVSAAAATVLGHLFPHDAVDLAAQAEEAKSSRLWAGIHFPLDNEMGALGGGMVGELVIARATTGVVWDRMREAVATTVEA